MWCGEAGEFSTCLVACVPGTDPIRYVPGYLVHTIVLQYMNDEQCLNELGHHDLQTCRVVVRYAIRTEWHSIIRRSEDSLQSPG